MTIRKSDVSNFKWLSVYHSTLGQYWTNLGPDKSSFQMVTVLG